MQRQRLPQQMHRARPYEQEMGTKSGRRFGKAFPLVAWIVVLAAGVVAFRGAQQLMPAHAASQSGRRGPESEAILGGKHGQRRASGCVLIVPANPLTAQGLATPYQLTGKLADGTPCHESNTAVAAFVQGAVLDPATGQVSVYNPLVIDQGTQPAAAPVTPTLPANAVVGIWFGANGTSLRLQGANGTTLSSGMCVDGLGQSNFGQVAYCNAPAFFSEANSLIQAKKLTAPALGTGSDGMTCPTVRDFSVVDQDQSDNVTTRYLLTQDGKIAQNTAANISALNVSATFGNGSDNGLVAVALDNALGCSPWKAPDLANPGQMVPAQPLNELQAAMYQAVPVALVPSGDPMTLVNGRPNLTKQNLYRAGVDQPNEASVQQAAADERAYCQNILNTAPARIQADESFTSAAGSPDPAVANSLFTFLASRLSVTIGPDELNCTGLLNVANPVHLTTDNNGVVVGATFSAPNATGAQTGQKGGN